MVVARPLLARHSRAFNHDALPAEENSRLIDQALFFPAGWFSVAVLLDYSSHCSRDGFSRRLRPLSFLRVGLKLKAMIQHCENGNYKKESWKWGRGWCMHCVCGGCYVCRND